MAWTRLNTAALLMLLPLAVAGCRMDNPAFGEEEGESSSSSSSEGGGDTQADESSSETSSSQGESSTDDTSSASSETDTGESDTSSGDGDDTADTSSVDSGDGDGNVGDGDGDIPCELLEVPIIADTWLVSGPQEGDPPSCLLGGNLWGPDGAGCDYLNFGATEGLWMGEVAASSPGVSVMLLKFDSTVIQDAGLIDLVESADLYLYVEATDTLPSETIVWAELMPPGDGYDWAEGDLDGAVPPKASGITTYKYRSYGDSTWPNSSPFSPTPVDLGGVNVSGAVGEFELIMSLDPDLTAQWFEVDSSNTMHNGIMVGSNAMPFQLLGYARESGALAHLDISVCY